MCVFILEMYIIPTSECFLTRYSSFIVGILKLLNRLWCISASLENMCLSISS